jgi:sulfur carrier protein
MRILLNGQPLDLPDAITVAGLLQHLGHGERRIAVEVNRQIVPRSAHARQQLAPGDQVELVEAFGGG